MKISFFIMVMAQQAPAKEGGRRPNGRENPPLHVGKHQAPAKEDGESKRGGGNFGV